MSTDEVKQAVEAVTLSWATMTATQKKDDLTATLNAEIASTKNTWVKIRDKGYIVLLGFASDALLNKINSWVS